MEEREKYVYIHIFLTKFLLELILTGFHCVFRSKYSFQRCSPALPGSPTSQLQPRPGLSVPALELGRP